MEYLAVGHVTRDLVEGGSVPGGSSYYSALCASALGMSAGIWTGLGPGYEHMEALGGVELLVEPSDDTTTFENIYQDGVRLQYVRGRAKPLDPRSIQEQALAGVRIVHLCPVIQEVELALAARFEARLVGIGVQGWIRRVDSRGRVHPRRWEGFEEWLGYVDLAVLSDVEAEQQPDLVPRLIERVPLVAVTEGAKGSTLFVRGRAHHVDAAPAREVDPTGAGDVYTAAMLVALARGRPPLDAARFASEVAARIVEGRGGERFGEISGAMVP